MQVLHNINTLDMFTEIYITASAFPSVFMLCSTSRAFFVMQENDDDAYSYAALAIK